jgi:hypothetical protein
MVQNNVRHALGRAQFAQKNSGMHHCIPESSLSILLKSVTSSSFWLLPSALPWLWLLPSALLSLLPFYSPLKRLEFASAKS